MLACFGLATVLAIAGTASDSLIVAAIPKSEDQDLQAAGIGIWSAETITTTGDGGTFRRRESIDCTQSTFHNNGPGSDEEKSACVNALTAKCGTCQAFSIIGILSSAAAAIVVLTTITRGGQINGVSKVITAAAGGLASLSALIIFAVVAQLWQQLQSPVTSTSCSLGPQFKTLTNFGAAFGLWVVVWLSAGFGTVISFASTGGHAAHSLLVQSGEGAEDFGMGASVQFTRQQQTAGGTEVTASPFCPQCGAPQPPGGARFCVSCGGGQRA